MRPWALVALAVACGSPAAPTPPAPPTEPAETEPTVPSEHGVGALPDDSLFHLEPTLVDQDGRPFVLASLRGRPTLVTFFYASCTTMCPLVLSEVRLVDRLLEDEEHPELQVLLVSIDPRDTPETLRALASERGLPLDRYRLVRGEPGEIRTLAATLGMTYRPIADGGFAHSALFTVLDADGRITFQHDGLGTGTERLRDQVRALLPRPG